MGANAANQNLRIAILGNAGSGKSYLAQKLGRSLKIPVLYLDDIFWLPDGRMEKRPPSDVRQLLFGQTAGNAWIIEGVYGELVEAVIDRVDVLIWLALDWPACRASLLERRSANVNMQHLTPEEQAESFNQLLTYAEAYEHRDNPRSRQAHSRLLESFTGAAIRLDDRSEVNRFIQRIDTQGYTAFHPPTL